MSECYDGYLHFVKSRSTSYDSRSGSKHIINDKYVLTRKYSGIVTRKIPSTFSQRSKADLWVCVSVFFSRTIPEVNTRVSTLLPKLHGQSIHSGYSHEAFPFSCEGTGTSISIPSQKPEDNNSTARCRPIISRFPSAHHISVNEVCAACPPPPVKEIRSSPFQRNFPRKAFPPDYPSFYDNSLLYEAGPCYNGHTSTLLLCQHPLHTRQHWEKIRKKSIQPVFLLIYSSSAQYLSLPRLSLKRTSFTKSCK